jgi:tetratricopeptide (TPR) repeat protein
MKRPLEVRKSSSTLLTWLLLSCLSFDVLAADANITEAESLLKSGNYNAAYALLEPLESENAGNPEFDYLFGLASLDSGHASRAMFALERVLAVNPDHVQARAEIARAHLMLGELDTARVEFKNVLNQNPPADSIATINRYLSVISRESGEKTRFGAYLEATWGYDSNVNSAPTPGQFIANIGGIPQPVNLADSSSKTSSNFFTMGGGVNFQHPISNEMTVLGSVSGTNRVNLSSDDAELFDTSSIDFSLGLRYRKGAETLSATWQDSNFNLNGERFRHAYGLQLSGNITSMIVIN